jgi:hypothetical protein
VQRVVERSTAASRVASALVGLLLIALAVLLLSMLWVL